MSYMKEQADLDYFEESGMDPTVEQLVQQTGDDYHRRLGVEAVIYPRQVNAVLDGAIRGAYVWIRRAQAQRGALGPMSILSARDPLATWNECYALAHQLEIVAYQLHDAVELIERHDRKALDGRYLWHVSAVWKRSTALEVPNLFRAWLLELWAFFELGYQEAAAEHAMEEALGDLRRMIVGLAKDLEAEKWLALHGQFADVRLALRRALKGGVSWRPLVPTDTHIEPTSKSSPPVLEHERRG